MTCAGKGSSENSQESESDSEDGKSRDLALTGRSLEAPVNGILVSLHALSKVVKKDTMVDQAKEMTRLNPEMQEGP